MRHRIGPGRGLEFAGERRADLLVQGKKARPSKNVSVAQHTRYSTTRGRNFISGREICSEGGELFTRLVSSPLPCGILFDCPHKSRIFGQCGSLKYYCETAAIILLSQVHATARRKAKEKQDFLNENFVKSWQQGFKALKDSEEGRRMSDKQVFCLDADVPCTLKSSRPTLILFRCAANGSTAPTANSANVRARGA